MGTRCRAVWLGFAACLLLAGQTHGGAFVLQGDMQEGALKVAAALPTLNILYSATDVQLEDAAATLRISEDFTVAVTGDAPAWLIVPLPDGVDRESVELRLDGHSQAPAGMLRIDGEQAASLLRAAAETHRRDGLLLHLGQPLLVVPLPGVREPARLRLALACRVPVEAADGLVRLRCPVPEVALACKPVGRMVVSGSVVSARPVRAVFSPTHTCRVVSENPRRATFRYVADHVAETIPFDLLAVTDESEFGWRTLAYRPQGAAEGTFAIIGCPTGGDTQGQTAREVVLAMDVSGSMRGEKLEQARAAIEYCLGQLDSADAFNIVAFSDRVTTFAEAPVGADAETIARARVFIDGLQPEGRTNIDDALAACVRGAADTARPRVVIFLTDGTPTAGDRNPASILAHVEKANTASARIFVVGIGHDINTYLLDQIALATDGGSEYVAPDGAVDEQVADLYARLAHPVLLGATADFRGMPVTDVVPGKIGDVYRGSLVVLAGRYAGACTGVLHIAGHRGDASRELQIPIELPATTGSDMAFVAPLWASRRVGECLEQMRLEGSDAALDEVVSLSRRYGIVTEYTTAIDAADAPSLSDAEVASQAREQLRRARNVNSGKWAVMQSVNDKGLKNKVAVNSAENGFMDAQGEKKEASSVKQINGSAFYQKDGAWLEADDGVERAQRSVKRYSPEYFRLVEESEDFSRAAALDGEVILNHGNEQIRVH